MCVCEGWGGGEEEEDTDLDLKHKEDSENCSEGRGKLRFRVSITLLKTLAGKLSNAKQAILFVEYSNGRLSHEQNGAEIQTQRAMLYAGV